MKNILIIAFLGLTSSSGFSQLYVSNNSYVFVNDQQVYVDKEVNLNGNGAVYLRKEGQLLQGVSTPNNNVGTGFVSVYQEGTSNNFGYNYWSSPVGNSNAVAGNSNFTINQLSRPTTVTNSTPATLLAANNYNGVATNTSLSIAPFWIWKYIASNEYNPGGPNGWINVGTSGSVAPGLGFTMKGVSGSDNTIAHPIAGNLGDGKSNNAGNNQRYDFRGKPNNGNIQIPVGVGAGTYTNNTLTGNPYPSAINLNLFLLENSGFVVNYTDGTYAPGGTAAINGNAYFWEQRKTASSHVLVDYEGGYGNYAPTGPLVTSPGTYTAATWNTYNGDGSPNTTGASSGTAYKRMFSPVGQGFLVQGTISGNAVMKNQYRSFVKEGVTSNSEFERNANATGDNWEPILNVAGINYENFSKLPAPQFKLHTVINNQYTKETAVAFNDNASDGYDMALDGIATETPIKDFYFPLNGDKKAVITTLPFNEDKKIPVAFSADTRSSFKITVSELINFSLAENIYVHDTTTDTYYDIKNGFFDITLDAGNYKERFEITFKNTDTTLSENTLELQNNVTVFQNNETQNLTLLNPKLYDVAQIAMYDVAGKNVISKSKIGNAAQYEIPTGNLSHGVYIVKLTTAEGISINKKVLISKD